MVNFRGFGVPSFEGIRASLVLGCLWVAVSWAAIAGDVACSDAGPVAAAPVALMGNGAPSASWNTVSEQAAAVQLRDGVVSITLKPGAEPFPGVALVPSSGHWNLSAFSEVIARVTNRGTEAARVGVRVDDSGTARSGRWNAGAEVLRPGESGTVTVVFGRSGGVAAPPIDRANSTRIVIFGQVPAAPLDLRLDALVAADGSTLEMTGVSLGQADILGNGSCIDRSLIALGLQGAKASLEGRATQRVLRVQSSAAQGGAVLRPLVGTWDLRSYLELSLRMKNAGTRPITVRGRIESESGETPWSGGTIIAPGTSDDLVLTFLPAQPAELDIQPTAKFASDKATAVALDVQGPAESDLVVSSLRAQVPPPRPLPDWIGKRPPVPGDWVQTLNEDFEGDAVDAKIWSVTGTNFWEKASHFSRSNVVVGGGVARLRFEHRRGHANDDPRLPETDYATGYLDSEGKWSQLYGYFEARMKLPKAAGLWPAIWMMPDRGPGVANRHSTFDGGMEFDILEYLTRFGPYRYNVALHWDGYGAGHKVAGSDGIYAATDADGYLVAGLLWEPGTVVFYANGMPVAKRSDPRIGSTPERLLVTLIQGGWGGNDLDGTGLPDELTIDWIRAWQRRSRLP